MIARLRCWLFGHDYALTYTETHRVLQCRRCPSHQIDGIALRPEHTHRRAAAAARQRAEDARIVAERDRRAGAMAPARTGRTALKVVGR